MEMARCAEESAQRHRSRSLDDYGLSPFLVKLGPCHVRRRSASVGPKCRGLLGVLQFSGSSEFAVDPGESSFTFSTRSSQSAMVIPPEDYEHSEPREELHAQEEHVEAHPVEQVASCCIVQRSGDRNFKKLMSKLMCVMLLILLLRILLSLLEL